MLKSFGTEKMTWKSGRRGEARLERSVGGSSEEDMAVSEDGKNDNGRKEEKERGGRTDREVSVSDEKSGWRSSVSTCQR